jgi:solute:Na+ symporter, SSS family
VNAVVNIYSLAVASVAFLWIGGTRASSDGPAAGLPDGTRSLCDDVLTRALSDESPVVRVHAAESLTSLDRPEPVLEAFRPKSKTTEPVTRILIWRVLAAAEPEAETRRRYVERIRTVLLDPSSPDSIHAMESLAKLNEPAAGAERRLIRVVADGAGPASPFALWRLAQAGEGDSVARLAKLLHSNDGVTRLRAAYVLGRLRPRYPAARDALSAALATEPPDSPSRPMLRAAAGSDTARELLGDTDAGPVDRYFAAMFLADTGVPSDYPRLTNLLRNPHSDLRVGAAYALLKINARSKTSGSDH